MASILGTPDRAPAGPIRSHWPGGGWHPADQLDNGAPVATRMTQAPPGASEIGLRPGVSSVVPAFAEGRDQVPSMRLPLRKTTTLPWPIECVYCAGLPATSTSPGCTLTWQYCTMTFGVAIARPSAARCGTPPISRRYLWRAGSQSKSTGVPPTRVCTAWPRDDIRTPVSFADQVKPMLFADVP